MNIHFGVDYYPEHWPKERWETDARLMQEMGIQVVRMAEFSWHKLEPSEGNYDFTWLDEAISLLADYGIKTIVGTPSAAPPAWMITKHPKIQPIDREGRVRHFGGRHHDCQSNPTYRKYIRKMVTALAKHYGTNSNVIGWQPDNELGNSHGDLCTCTHCQKSFQNWLQKKYLTVDHLNKAWGTAFWGQEVNDFSEVSAPRITVTGENPSQMLDWNYFCSALIVDFMKEQTDIIRSYAKNQFITHNFMGFADKVDYYDLAKELDFVSHDQYPGGFFAPDQKNHELAASLDIVRSYKNQNFWIMEQQSGVTGWEVMGRAPVPGQLSAWTIQSVAHGADAIVFFRWRVCAMGTEQYWHGILPHSGNPGRRYQELKQTIDKMSPIMDKIQGSMPKAETGILFSFEQDYALKIQPNHPDLSYIRQIQKYYKALYDRKITTDFVPSDGDFSQYKLLIAPLQYLMTPALEEKYFDYVKSGGHLILTMRTGVKDEHNLCMTERELPGRLAELAGVTILDYDCLIDQTTLEIDYKGKSYTANLWADIMETDADTTVLAKYASEFYKDTAVMTVHPYGSGSCSYIGTEPDEALLGDFIHDLTSQLGIESLGTCDNDVELMSRENDQYKWIFAINLSNEKKCFTIDSSYHMILGENAGSLSPFETQIFEKEI